MKQYTREEIDCIRGEYSRHLTEEQILSDPDPTLDQIIHLAELGVLKCVSWGFGCHEANAIIQAVTSTAQI